MAFDLEALGGLRLLSADGRVVQAQRRRLALLGLLSAAGERGLTRDKLIGCLWPEATEEHAKHALNQLLYGIRRSLSEDALRGVDPLRLESDIVDSDVRRFECALSAGAYCDAIAHYRGPFLDGFYLPDAPAFESRVEAERARLAAAYADALDRLAAEAEGRGDAHAAVGWRRTLAELDPLDARRATAFMRALAAAGDSSRALAHGLTYQAIVQAELNAPADRSVIALADEIRASSERQSGPAARPVRAIGAAAPLAAPNADLPIAPARPDRERAVAVANASPGATGARRGSRRHRGLFVAAAVAIVILLGTLTSRSPVLGRSAVVTPAADRSLDTRVPTIAVLPLRNLSTDPGDTVFADGMTEELIAMLSTVGSLRVIASTSVSLFKESGLDLPQIAESLHVSHVLEGSMEKVGPRMRLRLRLVDGRDASTRWGETYHREIVDMFAVQEDIARAVARELDVQLAVGGRTPRGRPRTSSVEAYEWYLRATSDPSGLRIRSGNQKRMDYLQRAIAADSNFAAAYASMVDAYIRAAGDGPGNALVSFARAEQAGLKAVALDSSLPEAYRGLGRALVARRKWGEAEAALTRAIALDPSASRAFEWLALLYTYTGRPAEQLAAARAGANVDPLSATAITRLAIALAMNGRCDEAIERLGPLKTLPIPAGVAGVVRGQCFAADNKWPEAIAEFRWALKTTEARMARSFLGYALARAGQRDEAERILRELLTARQYSHGSFGIAVVYAGLGDYDNAFAWLDKAVDDNTVRPYIMGVMFEDLRRDPRFDRFKRRMGLQTR